MKKKSFMWHKSGQIALSRPEGNILWNAIYRKGWSTKIAQIFHELKSCSCLIILFCTHEFASDDFTECSEDL
jgi:hypothetical protein